MWTTSKLSGGERPCFKNVLNAETGRGHGVKIQSTIHRIARAACGPFRPVSYPWNQGAGGSGDLGFFPALTRKDPTSLFICFLHWNVKAHLCGREKWRPLSRRPFWVCFSLLLSYNKQRTLHSFQVYTLMIWYFYISQREYIYSHHDKSR